MDIVELHNRSVGAFAQLVQSVRNEQWSAPTPCAEWDVRALVNHVVGEERWTVPLMAGRTIADVGTAFDGDLLGDDPARTALIAAADAQLAAGTDVRTVHLSYGDESTDEYLRQLVADHLIHTWDLAAAVGADRSLDAELVAEVTLWFAERAELYRSAGMVGDPLPSSADPADALLAAFGRDPSWSPALDLVNRFGAAFDRCDLDAVLALVTPGCVFESTSPAPDGQRFEGADAVRAEWRKLFENTVEPRFETEETIVAGDRAVVRWHYSWRAETGGRGHVRGVDVMRLRDGKIAEKLSYVKG
ncbi:TIGR03086 family protein [Kribbella sandramycini]|uniref:TIGR03086 family protein n=1 Tax=Kribbella sandramycini TaxID=60450 RepID=A0A7Y4L0U1_9ACTN|nr:TIGR03086 family metal-binding protein [Kribbella sandramycini]NOL42253.1 TIGR03086 family protein [Kribbella sandramycini]